MKRQRKAIFQRRIYKESSSHSLRSGDYLLLPTVLYYNNQMYIILQFGYDCFNLHNAKLVILVIYSAYADLFYIHTSLNNIKKLPDLKHTKVLNCA